MNSTAPTKKIYWPGWNQLSSWQCDRLLSIPKEALKKQGGYILEVEANGQTYYAPILVDPLSMLMRRCREGVFALVNDADGKKAVSGAQLTARGAMKGEVTDENGAAFLKVFATGDRAILA